MPSSTIPPSAPTRGDTVAASAAGCSRISLIMKWACPPFSALVTSQSTSISFFSTRPAALVEHPRPVPCQANHLAVRQLEDPPGVRQHGGDIGRDEVALLRQPDNQRAGTTHRDDLVRMLGAQHPQGVGTLQPGDGRPHRGGEIPGIRLFDEVGDDLGVRLGKERHPFILQLLFQHGVVLDDPVVHHGEPPA